jgi:hypothetical protein
MAAWALASGHSRCFASRNIAFVAAAERVLPSDPVFQQPNDAEYLAASE